jgi:RNA polymerase sigma-70 factor (ECF subfamily)
MKGHSALPLNPEVEPIAAARPSETYTRQSIAEFGAKFVPQTLRYLGVPDEVLLDAAQDVLVVALRRSRDFEHRSTVKTWLFGICIRVAHEHRRKRHKRREILVEALPEMTTPPGQEAAVEKAEWRRALGAVLDLLSEEQRAAFVLFEIQRLSMKEVAEALGCPLQTAYFRHKAARTRVLEAFAGKHAGKGEK